MLQALYLFIWTLITMVVTDHLDYCVKVDTISGPDNYIDMSIDEFPPFNLMYDIYSNDYTHWIIFISLLGQIARAAYLATNIAIFNNLFITSLTFIVFYAVSALCLYHTLIKIVTKVMKQKSTFFINVWTNKFKLHAQSNRTQRETRNKIIEINNSNCLHRAGQKPAFISLIISGVLSLIFVIFGTRIPTFTKFDYYTGYAFLALISVLLLLAVIIAIFEVGDWPVVIFLSAIATSFIWFNKYVQLANSNYQIWLSSLIGTTIILVAYYKSSSIVD